MRKYNFGILIISLLSAFTVRGFAADDSGTMFFKGNLHYKEGEYQQAIAAYESVIAGGEVSGQVYYNLGNSYFKAGQLGKAIVNYERARALMPRDSDLESNYRHTQTLIKFYKPVKKTLMERVLDGHMDSLTLDEITMILFGLLLGMGAIHLASLYQEWPGQRRRIMVGVLLLFFIAYSYGFIFKVQGQKDAAVAIADTQAKFEPREETTTYFDLSEGYKVHILKEESAWSKVKRLDGKIGWVKTEDLERI